jgi:hypothetical protein
LPAENFILVCVLVDSLMEEDAQQEMKMAWKTSVTRVNREILKKIVHI